MKTKILLKDIFTQANIYTVISLLYFLRHIIFGHFSIIGRGLYVLFYLLSFFYFIKANKECRITDSLKALNVCLVIIFIHGFLLLLFGMDSTWKRSAARGYYLLIHWESILPIYAFYFFSVKRQIDERWFRFIAIFFFITAYIQFGYAGMLKEENLNREEVVNNEAYLWVSLFPVLAFFDKKPIIKYVGSLIILYFLITGFKRGAILLGGICFMFFLWGTIRHSKGYVKWLSLAISVALIYIVYRYIETYLLVSDLMAKRLEVTMEGHSSGRDVIYANYWSFYCHQDNFFAMIFGNGAFGTLKYLGLMAHNDWLEFLIDTGMIGTVAYMVYWIKNIQMCIKSASICSHEVFLGILFFVTIYLGCSLFSMSIMSMPFYATSVFGYLVSQYDYCNKKVHIKR